MREKNPMGVQFPSFSLPLATKSFKPGSFAPCLFTLSRRTRSLCTFASWISDSLGVYLFAAPPLKAVSQICYVEKAKLTPSGMLLPFSECDGWHIKILRLSCFRSIIVLGHVSCSAPTGCVDFGLERWGDLDWCCLFCLRVSSRNITYYMSGTCTFLGSGGLC